MSEFYIPPEGIFFRLLGWRSSRVIFSREKEPQVATYDGWKENEYDDQYFTLVPGEGVNKGRYLIRSKWTHKVLYARSLAQPQVGHIGGDGDYMDNWFWIEQGVGKHAKRFRLLTSGNDSDLVWGPTAQMGVPPPIANAIDIYLDRKFAVVSDGNGKLNTVLSGTRSEDQWFSFLYEDMVLERIIYNPEKGQKKNEGVEVVGTQTQNNDSGSNQNMAFSFEYSKSDSSTFEHGYGLSLKIGTEFETGIPFIAEGKISTELTTSVNVKWGSSTTEGRKYTTNFPVVVRPHQKMVATCIIKRATIEVPYTMVMKSAETGRKVESTGTYKGVSAWDLQCDFKETPL